MERRSIRLKSYDYSGPGFYYITICTHARIPIFGDIDKGAVILSEYGNLANSLWQRIPQFFNYTELDAFIIMHDHLYGILRFNEGNTVALGEVIRNFKSTSARRINLLRKSCGRSVWQRNYYEHVIRKERELNLIRLYIDLNPVMWEKGARLGELTFESEDEIIKILSRYRGS